MIVLHFYTLIFRLVLVLELKTQVYYRRIKILGSCLFLQSVPANLHAILVSIKQVI